MLRLCPVGTTSPPFVQRYCLWNWVNIRNWESKLMLAEFFSAFYNTRRLNWWINNMKLERNLIGNFSWSMGSWLLFAIGFRGLSQPIAILRKKKPLRFGMPHSCALPHLHSCDVHTGCPSRHRTWLNSCWGFWSATANWRWMRKGTLNCIGRSNQSFMCLELSSYLDVVFLSVRIDTHCHLIR